MTQFIRENPHYFSAYFRLSDLYSFSKQTDKGLAFFTQLSVDPRYRFGSLWVLASQFQSQENWELAGKYYRILAQNDSLSFDFIKKMARFLYFSLKKKDLAAFHQFGLSAKYDAILQLLFKYYRKDYQGVIDFFPGHNFYVSDDYRILDMVANCQYRLKNFIVADSLFRRALYLSRAANDVRTEIRILHDLSVVELSLKKVNLFEAHLDTALNKALKINDLYSMQLIMGNEGRYFYQKGFFEKAKSNLYQAYRIAARTKNYQAAIRWGYYYGNALYQTKEFSDAVEVYDQSEKYAREIHRVDWAYGFMVAKGNIYEYLNQNDLAKKIFDNAYRIATKYNWRQEAFDVRGRYANILLKEKRFDEVRVIYQDYIDFIQRSKSAKKFRELIYWKWKYAQTYYKEKNYKKASEHFAQVEQMAQKHNFTDIYRWAILGLAQSEDGLGNSDEAKQYYEQVLDLLKESKDRSDEEFADVFLGLGSVFHKKNEWREAIRYFLQAASYVENIRSSLKVTQFRLGYFSRETEAYDNLVECYFRLYLQEKDSTYLDSLFYFDQMSKSRVLSEIQNGNRLKNNRKQNPIFWADYINARLKLQSEQRAYRLMLVEPDSGDKIAQLLTQIETDKYTLIEKRLALIQRQGIEQKGKALTFVVPFSQALAVVKSSGISLLMYHLSENESFAMVVTGDKVAMFPLKKNKDFIEEKVRQLMTPFHNVSSDSILYVPYRAEIAHQLYQILMEPAEKTIGLSRRVFVVPDGDLFGLSFEMLLAEKPNKNNFTPMDDPVYQSDLLVNHFSFSYAPSPYFIKQDKKAIPSNPNFLIIANPVDSFSLKIVGQTNADSLRLSQLGPLPFAEAEAKQIKRVVPQAIILHREQATEDNFNKIASAMNVLHLATHGLFDNRFDAFSGLFMALGNDTINDGLLLGYEISDLNLHSTLVTLSACETGRGKTVAGEGVLGLPRLFLGAGAKIVLMTLWKVDDQFTSELMPAFYENLFRKKMIVSDALSQAKLVVMKQGDSEIHYEHPFFWAAFCLYGEPTVFVKAFPWLKWIAILGFLLLSMMVVVYFYFIRGKRYKKQKDLIR
ncbi:MAG: CHAT domain-containing protein [Calditrichaeota bacterium]|nr:CHAT domain-containing protein [Calditrichota bacterium]